MPTVDELFDMLGKADAEGDVEAAKFFASEIEKLQTAPEPQRDVKAEFEAMPWYQKAGTATADVLRLANKGLTMGWGDKLSALALSSLQGGDYDQELARQQGLTSEAKERAGSAALPAEITGGMVTGGAATKMGTELLKRVPIAGIPALTGGVPQSLPLTGRLAAGGATGALEGSAYGAAQAAAEDRPVQEGINEGLLFGALGGAGGEAISSLGNWLANRGKDVVPKLDELQREVSEGYQRMQDSGVELRPEAVSQLNEDLRRNVTDNAGGARRGSHPKIYGEIDALQEYTPSIKDPVMKSTRTASTSDALTDTTTAVNGGKPVNRRVDRQSRGTVDRNSTRMDTRPDRGMSLYDLDEHRKAVRRSTKSDPVERIFGNKAISSIDDFADRLTAQDIKAGANVNVEDAVEDLTKTRKLAQRKLKLEELGSELRKGERQIDGNVNANPTDVLRGKVRGILNNDKKSMGYTPDEIQALEEINQGTGFGNAMRSVAKFGNNLGGAVAGGAAGGFLGDAMGLGAGYGAPAGVIGSRLVGSGASKLAERSTEKQIQKLLDTVARGGTTKKPTDAVGEATRAQLSRLLMLLGLEEEPADK